MGTFVGVHNMGSAMTDDQAKSTWESYKAACTKNGLSAKHVHFSAELGRAFCITEASSKDEVQKAHDDAGVSVNEILEVQDFN